jgi:hypothetical protein
MQRQQASPQPGIAARDLRFQQQTNAQHPQYQNPLLKQANTLSICILFMLLIWRNLSVYELADAFVSNRMRTLTLPPLIMILLANLGGFLLNVMRPQGFKNQLKVILAANIVREWAEMLYSIVMLVTNTRYSSIPRDVYIGRFFMNVWWIAFCTGFSKSRWVMNPVPQPANKNLNQAF